jgi:antitoxin (DNA-binding transcriptional repressor) of toxin-antitoxin stability system
MTAIGFVKEGKYVGARELRENLSKVLKSRQSYFVTDHGRPVKAMIAYDVLLELLEILEELKDKALIQEVAEGRKEYLKGGWIPASRLKKQL